VNIFYTNHDPALCAREHCDRHMVKMILESAQLLSTAHHAHGSAAADMYRPTHQQHPCALWTRASYDHYVWLHTLFAHLLISFERKTGRSHASSRLYLPLRTPPAGIAALGFAEPPECMPDQYKVGSVVHSYHAYLNAKFAEWESRARPLSVEWWHGEVPGWKKYFS
jgi:hypothetical protein